MKLYLVLKERKIKTVSEYKTKRVYHLQILTKRSIQNVPQQGRRLQKEGRGYKKLR